ncbi:4Fe-4S dicluster domain-containing protein [Romboutsia sp.]|uniref:4Fe-4S dicluster domain-containing protein n=1 Tax=Romboutsia sp. TaxID=1965302 RepID=UPI003F3404DB
MDTTTIVLTQEQIKSVKGKGFLHNRGTRNFSGRIITENGILTGRQMAILSEAAERFGNGNISFTVRLTVEVQGIDFDNIEPFREYIAKEGMVTGGTGSRVRPIVACKGSTCVFGLCDTHGIATEMHERFYEGYYDVVLPHKFKIAIGGCPNNCAKPDLNDIGLVGQRVMKFDMDKCRGCAKCGVIENCPMDAVSLQGEKIVVENDKCNNCGRCLSKCVFKVTEECEEMYKIYLGGKWGKQVRMGNAINKLFTKEEALGVVEKSVLLFKSKGISGERFGETVDRLGIEKAEKMLISNNLLKNKEDILEIETVAGAKC